MIVSAGPRLLRTSWHLHSAEVCVCVRVGEEACPTLEQAKARLKELYPSKPGWTPRWSSATASAWPSTQRRTGIHIDLDGCSQTAPQNSPQSMRVWPGLRLMGAGGKIPKGVFVAVAEVEPDGVRLDNGMRLKNQELLWPPGQATQ